MSVTRCTHLKINGNRCKMLAVNGKDLCFAHESRLIRLRKCPCPPRDFVTVPLVSLAYPEDHDAILENVHAIACAVVQSDINDRQAGVLDCLMNTALRTLRERQKLEKTLTSEEMVRHFRLDEDGNPRAVDDDQQPDNSEASPAEPESAGCDPLPPQPSQPTDSGEPVPTVESYLASIRADKARASLSLLPIWM